MSTHRSIPLSPMADRPRSGPRLAGAFSLVELLVVIATFATLLWLIREYSSHPDDYPPVPHFNNAREVFTDATVSHGLTVRMGGEDGLFEEVKAGPDNTGAWKVNGPYLYLDVDNEFARSLNGPVTMDVTYLDAAAYITWMLPGDLLKMFTWLYGMVMLGAGDARRSMMSDLTWCAGFLIISLGGIAVGFQFAPCLAFTVMYAVTLVINATVSRRCHGVSLSMSKALLVASLTGLAALVAWLTA